MRDYDEMFTTDWDNPTHVLKRFWYKGDPTKYFISDHGNVYIKLKKGLKRVNVHDDPSKIAHKHKNKAGKWVKYNSKHNILAFIFKDRNRVTHTAYIHKQVYKLFIGEVPDEKEVHHIDLDSTNNIATNLLAVTKPEHVELHKLAKTDYKKYLERIEELRHERY